MRADSGGVPWAGRTLEQTGFENDDGAGDPDLLNALDDPILRGERAEDPDHPADAEQQLLSAISTARLLVPVVAVPGDIDDTNDTLAEAGSSMASVRLTAPDGTSALPVFSSITALSSWDPAARPVPVSAQRAALAAIQEECQVMVLDLLPPGMAAPARSAARLPPYELRTSMVWALAEGRAWLPAHRDPQVAAAVQHAVSAEAVVTSHQLSAGAGGALVIELTLLPGLTAEEVQSLASRVGERIAGNEKARSRLDAVTFQLTSA